MSHWGDSNKLLKHMSRWDTYVIQTVKKTIEFCEKGPFKSVCCFYYFFRCFDENKNNLKVLRRTRVLIFADLMYYHIVIVVNTQAQYFDKRMCNCTGVFSTMTIRLCINCVNKILVSCFTIYVKVILIATSLGINEVVLMSVHCNMEAIYYVMSAYVWCASNWWSGCCGFDPRWVRILSMVMPHLRWIKNGSCEFMAKGCA